MTEEEKKARLDELRNRLKSKKAASAMQDKEEAKRNEVGTGYLGDFFELILASQSNVGSFWKSSLK